jgi:DoxX-like family
MNDRVINKLLTYCIAAVWIINGLFCKVLNFAPRHEKIVARILSEDYSRLFTIAIGFGEIAIAIWMLSYYRTGINAIVQIVIVAAMNLIEFIFVPDLLLWGKFNSLFALLFIVVVYFNAFHFNKKQHR